MESSRRNPPPQPRRPRLRPSGASQAWGLRVLLAGILLQACVAAEPPPEPIADHLQAELAMFARNLNLVTAEDTPLPLPLAVTDIAGDPVTVDGFEVLQAPRWGRVLYEGSQLVYIPDPDFDGQDEWTYLGRRDGVASVPGRVRIDVTPVNDPPHIEPLELFTEQGMPAEGMLAATDPEGDLLRFSVHRSTLDGSIELDADTGFVRFIPLPAFHGSTSFDVVVDDGRLSSQPATVSVHVLRREAPVLGTVILGRADNAVLRQSWPVALTVPADSRAHEMRIYGDLITPTSWIPWVETQFIALTPLDGDKTVWVEVRDNLGNVAGPVAAGNGFDGNGPTGSITARSAFVNVTEVVVDLSYEDYSGVDGMSFDCSTPAWEPPAPVTTLTLVDADGPHVLEVCFRDTLGNIGGPFTDTVTLDRVLPIGTITAPTRTAALSVPVTTITDGMGSPVTAIRLDGDFIGAGVWQSPTETRQITLTGDDGDKPLTLQVADAAGNLGLPVTAVVELDRTGPLIVIGSGPTRFTQSTTDAVFQVAATDTGSVETWCRAGSADPESCSGSWIWPGPFDPGSSYTLSVTATDDLGNIGGPRTWSFTVTDAPLSCAGNLMALHETAGDWAGWTTEAPWAVTSDPLALRGAVLATGSYGPSLADRRASLDLAVPDDCWQPGRSRVLVHFAWRVDLADSGDRFRAVLRNNATELETTILNLAGPVTGMAGWATAAVALEGVEPDDLLSLRFAIDSNSSGSAGGIWIDAVHIERLPHPLPAGALQVGGSLESSPVLHSVGGTDLRTLVGFPDGTRGILTAAAVASSSWSLDDAMRIQGPVRGSLAVTLPADGGGLGVLAVAADRLVGLLFTPTGTITAQTTLSPRAAASPVLGRLTQDNRTGIVVGGTASGSTQLQALVWAAGAGTMETRWTRDFAGLGLLPDPVLLDLDGDGIDDVLTGSGQGLFSPRGYYALDGTDGAIRWSIETGLDATVRPLVGDFSGDSNLEMAIASGLNGQVEVYELDPDDPGAPRWTRTLDGPVAGMVAGDLDGRGYQTLVVSVGGTINAVMLLDGRDGRELGRFLIPLGASGPATLADLNDDGIVDILVGGNDGRLYALDGSLAWGHWVFAAGPANGIRAHPAVGDVDNDGMLDVVAGSLDGWLFRIGNVGPVPADPAQLPWPRFGHDALNRGVATDSPAP